MTMTRKFETELKNLHETAARVHESLTAAEQRRENKQANREAAEYIAEQMKDDAHANFNESLEKPENPTFSPLHQNADEIDEIDEIIDNGPLWQAAYLYIFNFDSLRAYKRRTLTAEQQQRITQRVCSSEKNQNEANLYLRTYNAFLQYGKVICNFQAEYQREAAILTGLIKRMETLQDWERDLLFFHEEYLKTNINGVPDFTTRAKLAAVRGKQKSILAQLKEQSKLTKAALKQLKNFIEPLFDYIHNDVEPPLWPLMPIWIENLVEYPDYIPEQDDPEMAKYFRFRLRQRREEGETISPEEEAIAYYPDYNELKTNREEMKQAKKQLLDIFNLWEANLKRSRRKR